MAERRMIAEALAAWTAAIPPEQVRRDAAFIEKDVLTNIP
jgi:hypothetical protein